MQMFSDIEKSIQLEYLGNISIYNDNWEQYYIILVKHYRIGGITGMLRKWNH
jgi:hypothetical protein